MHFHAHIADWRGTRGIIFNPKKNRVRLEVATGCYGGNCDICQQRLRQVSSWLRQSSVAFTIGKMYAKGSEHCIGYSFGIDPRDRTQKAICDAMQTALGVKIFPH